MSRRGERINSLLTEVIAEVILRDVKDPRLPRLVSITHVDVSADLRFAKVYVSVIGNEQEKKQALEVLTDAAGFIAVHASKKVVMRYFPSLTFKIDDSVEKHEKIDKLLSQIEEEKNARKGNSSHVESP